MHCASHMAKTRLSLRLLDFLIFWAGEVHLLGVSLGPGEEPGISLPGY